MPGKKTTKLWVPDEEVSPETLVKVHYLKTYIFIITLILPYLKFLILFSKHDVTTVADVDLLFGLKMK